MARYTKSITRANLVSDSACTEAITAWDNFVTENSRPPTVVEISEYYPDWIVWLIENDYQLESTPFVVKTRMSDIYYNGTYVTKEVTSSAILNLNSDGTLSSSETEPPESEVP